MGAPATPSQGVSVLQINARRGEPSRVAAIVIAVPQGTGTLVDVKSLGLDRLRNYVIAETAIIALVSDGTAFTASATPGGQTVGHAFSSNPATVTHDGLQWLWVQHNDAAAPHNVFIYVEGRLGKPHP